MPRPAAAERLSALRDRTVAIARAVVSSDAAAEVTSFVDRVVGEAAELLPPARAPAGLSPRSAAYDALLACGERISSRLVAVALAERGLRAKNPDSRDLFVTESRHGGASPLAGPTRARLRAALQGPLSEGTVPVIGGFIASGEDGSPTTLGRGGSDYSASIAGSALGAEEVQIWTDVDGVMTADPSLVASARSLPVLSLREASELAYFGGRVLHPSTMLPAIEGGIPIRVLNSRRPRGDGTLIRKDPVESGRAVKAVVYKKHISLIDIYSTRMLMAHGFLARVFAVFERFETAVDMVSTSEVSVSVTVDRPDNLTGILAGLSAFSRAETAPGKAIICVVGEGIRYTPGIAARVFSALGGVRVRMISLGASRVNVGLVVDEKDLVPAVRRLHATFFEATAPQEGRCS